MCDRNYPREFNYESFILWWTLRGSLSREIVRHAYKYLISRSIALLFAPSVAKNEKIAQLSELWKWSVSLLLLFTDDNYIRCLFINRVEMQIEWLLKWIIFNKSNIHFYTQCYIFPNLRETTQTSDNWEQSWWMLSSEMENWASVDNSNFASNCSYKLRR